MRLPTIPLEDARPGDMIFVVSKGIYGRLIRVGQRLQVLGLARGLLSFVYRQRWAPLLWLCRYSHMAMVVGWQNNVPDDPADRRNFVVRQAAARGIETAYLDTVGGKNCEIAVVPLDAVPTVDGRRIARGRVLAYAMSCQARYGFVTIASIILNLFTPRFVDIRRPGTLICSAFVARSGEHGGADIGQDPFQISPMEMALVVASSDHKR